MKKFAFFIILLIFSAFFITADEIVLDTPYNYEISLPIPDNYNDLVDLTIQIAELYWGERYDLEQTESDLEKALDQNDKLIVQLESTKLQLKSANDMISVLAKKVKELNKNDLFRWGINVFGGGVVKNDIISMSFKTNPYIQLFEFLNIGAYFEYPIGIGIQVGIQFK